MTKKRTLLLAALVVVPLAFSGLNCKGCGGGLKLAFGGLRVAGKVAGAAAVTAVRVGVVALRIAAWYHITHPIVIIPDPRVPHVYYQVDRGYRIYILRYSPDGHWVLIRTEDGRVGWVDARYLRGARAM